MHLERINSAAAPANTLIYFIQRADGGGPIKIGCTSDLPRRLETLISRRGESLVVLASAPGSFRDEKRLHAALVADRAYGEWFNATPAVLAAVGAARTGSALPDDVKRAARAARLSPSVSRVMGLDTAAAMLGGRNALAAALGIQPRSLRAKMSADRGVTDQDLTAASDALLAHVGRMVEHSRKLRAEAGVS